MRFLVSTPARPAARVHNALLAGALGLAAAGCGSEPPALEVAGIGYAENELLGLDEDRRLQLAELAALGVAVAEGEAESLAEPLVARAREEYLARALVAERALDSVGVTDAALRSHYAADPKLELTVRHLLVFSERFETTEARAAARAKAERALARIRAGEAFPSVAAEVSEEPGAEGREGLLEPGREGTWVGEFWEAARALEPGGVSPVVETRYGFHVLRLDARDTIPFEEVRPAVVLDVADIMGLETEPAGGEAGVETLAAEARARGIEAPPAVAAAARREWTDALARWTHYLGFREGMSRDEVRTAALDGLGATGQGPSAVRQEVHARGELLRARYPVRFAGDDGGGG